MKDQLKNIVVIFLGVLIALGITLGTSFALAEEGDHEHTSDEFEVTCEASPRFPVVGEEAELTCTVLHDGAHEEGLAVTLLLARTEADHHGEVEADHQDDASADGHDEAEADHQDDASADGHDEAEADHQDDASVDGHDEAEADHQDDASVDGHDEAEGTDAESVGVVAIEKMAGVYVAKYIFEQEGKYLGTVQIGEEQTDFAVAVRSKPVAWSFMAGLGGITIFVAGMVLIIKIVRKDW